MPNVLWTDMKGVKPPKLDKAVEQRVFAFIQKLRQDDTADGLRIKPMANAADPRARTGRVTDGWRAVLYRFDSSDGVRTYVYVGTWPHDEGIEFAKTRILDGNPVNGIAEFIDASKPDVSASYSDSHIAVPPVDRPISFLESNYNYSLSDLVGLVGFDETSARALLEASSEDAVLAIAEGFENAWQQQAALSLAVGEELGKIRSDLGIGADTESEDIPEETDDDRILRALDHPAARMQFAYIESDDALRKVIEGGDFGAWRVFLHPEQERYATRSFNGPFRLTGGAGTGKTVVLLHRARHLALSNPDSSIVLTTFTRALAENLDRDLAMLDSDLSRATALGDSGVYVRGVDSLAHSVRMKAGTVSFARASALIFGTSIGSVGNIVGSSDGWNAALDAVRPDLPPDLLHESFFEGEYLQVVLPTRISSLDEYLQVRRPGRGVPLDRTKRTEAWRVIERYREDARAARRLSYPEVAAVAAAWLDTSGESEGIRVDHLLVDEGQDLTASHWQFLRSLVEPGTNDLFLAEDTHQRIYGQHVVLSRYGIRIVGRSRRLTLNYRTTEQNLRSALRVLSAVEFTDSENEVENTGGYRSARSGPDPLLVATSSEREQLDRIATLISGWAAEGVPPQTIAVLARTNERATAVRDGLNERGLSLNLIKHPQVDGDKPLVLTMHTSKGMEFGRVILFDVSGGAVPLPAALRAAAADERDDVLLRERSLLYVASSRARDVLAITWSGSPSELLGLR